MRPKNPWKTLFSRYPALAGLAAALDAAAQTLESSIRAGRKILVCGNGGSAADSEHIVGELMKGFRHPRHLNPDQRARLETAFPKEGKALASGLQQTIAAISLASGVSLPTAFANDVDGSLVFAQQVLGLGCPGDVLWCISTSGNSANVLQALRVARTFGLKSIGLTGPGGGAMAALCDVLLAAPGSDTAEIQELHLPIYHALCTELEIRFFARPDNG